MTKYSSWNVHVSEQGQVVIQGEVDFVVAPKVRTQLMEIAEQSSGALHVDLSELSYLDSAGLALFIELRRVLNSQNREVVVDDVHPQVKKLFMLTQVGPLFGITE